MTASGPTILTFLGAVGTVTGSKFLVEHAGHRLLVDCGLYGGTREWRRRNRAPFAVDPGTVDDVVLSHNHLDHSGYLPALVRDGFAGPVWVSESAAPLVAISLRENAELQERDARVAQEGAYSRHDPPAPLYTVTDVERTTPRLRPTPFDVDVPVRKDMDFRLLRAGHVLGSACVHVQAGEGDVLVSGGLGRPVLAGTRPREAPPAARTVVIESTYGDREHPAEGLRPHGELASAIRRTVARGGSVLAPVANVDRTVQLLDALSLLMHRGQIPRVPVVVDSPTGLAALEVHRQALASGEVHRDDPLVELGDLRTALTLEESRALATVSEPVILVAAAGPATHGPAAEHLRRFLPDRLATVVLTDYQVAGSRGRALLDGARELKIMGRYLPVRAEVVQDEEFSINADSGELVAWLSEMPEPPETVFVVHGEPHAATALADRVRAELDCAVVVPRLGERVRLD